jgi:hypothetical protein
MAQTMYTNTNKWINKKINNTINDRHMFIILIANVLIQLISDTKHWDEVLCYIWAIHQYNNEYNVQYNTHNTASINLPGNSQTYLVIR